MHISNDQNSRVVHEISKILVTLDPNAVLESMTEFGLDLPRSQNPCIECAGISAPSDERFNQFVFSSLTETVLKNDCHVIFFKCINSANKKFDECLKAAGKDTDKIRKCLDQHAIDLKNCIHKFEDCKKKQGDD